jgi:hypothetical protein
LLFPIVKTSANHPLAATVAGKGPQMKLRMILASGLALPAESAPAGLNKTTAALSLYTLIPLLSGFDPVIYDRRLPRGTMKTTVGHIDVAADALTTQ